jgi:hypothetical protein
MKGIALGGRLALLLAAVLVFGALAWLNGGPVGNAGAWLMVLFAIWPAAMLGRGCAARLRKSEG